MQSGPAFTPPSVSSLRPALGSLRFCLNTPSARGFPGAFSRSWSPPGLRPSLTVSRSGARLCLSPRRLGRTFLEAVFCLASAGRDRVFSQGLSPRCRGCRRAEEHRWPLDIADPVTYPRIVDYK
jgi:hypothetical protein